MSRKAIRSPHFKLTKLSGGSSPKYSIEELTTLAKRFNKKHKAYAGYIAGVAIKTCFEKFPHFSDIPTNLSVQKFLEIIGIEEPEEIVIT